MRRKSYPAAEAPTGTVGTCSGKFEVLIFFTFSSKFTRVFAESDSVVLKPGKISSRK